MGCSSGPFGRKVTRFLEGLAEVKAGAGEGVRVFLPPSAAALVHTHGALPWDDTTLPPRAVPPSILTTGECLLWSVLRSGPQTECAETQTA